MSIKSSANQCPKQPIRAVKTIEISKSEAPGRAGTMVWSGKKKKNNTELNQELNTKQSLKLGSPVQESVLCLQDPGVDVRES